MKFLSDKQIKIFDTLCSSGYKNALVIGGKRAGKTYVILYYLLHLCIAYKKCRVLIVRKQLTDCISSIWLQLLPEVLEKSGIINNVQLIRSHPYRVVFPNESEIWIGGIDNIQRAEKIFGQEYSVIFVNEAVQISKFESDRLESILSKVCEREDGHVLNNKMLYDSNPSVRSNWLYKRFYKEKRTDDIILEMSPYENPFITREYIERLKNLKGAEKQRFLLGEWVSLEGCIYNHILDENKINIDAVKLNFDDIVAACDFGYYTHFVLAGKKENRWYILKELVLTDKTTGDLIGQIKSIKIKGVNLENVIIYCDHELDRIEEMNRAGLIAKKAKKEVGAGYDSVRRYELFYQLGECDRTFEQLQGLMRQQDNNGDYMDKQVKIDDHGADAVRYLIHSWDIDNSYSGDIEPIIITDDAVTGKMDW